MSKEITKELIEKLKPEIGPLTKLIIADKFKMTISEYEKWLLENENDELVKLLNHKILNSFYLISFKNKIPQGINLYVDNEIPKSQKGIKLEILNDINQIEKILQPFDINNNRINIENPRDEITTITDDDDLADFIEGGK